MLMTQWWRRAVSERSVEQHKILAKLFPMAQKRKELGTI
jgi:hypothetical protein